MVPLLPVSSKAHHFQAGPASLVPFLARAPPIQVLSEHAGPLLTKPLIPTRFKHVDLASRMVPGPLSLSHRSWSLWYWSLASLSLSFPCLHGLDLFKEVCTECLPCARHYVQFCKFEDQSDTPQEENNRSFEANENHIGKDMIQYKVSCKWISQWLRVQDSNLYCVIQLNQPL